MRISPALSGIDFTGRFLVFFSPGSLDSAIIGQFDTGSSFIEYKGLDSLHRELQEHVQSGDNRVLIIFRPESVTATSLWEELADEYALEGFVAAGLCWYLKLRPATAGDIPASAMWRLLEVFSSAAETSTSTPIDESYRRSYQELLTYMRCNELLLPEDAIDDVAQREIALRDARIKELERRYQMLAESKLGRIQLAYWRRRAR